MAEITLTQKATCVSDADISGFQEMMKYIELCPKCKSAYWIFQDEQKKEMIKKGIGRRRR